MHTREQLLEMHNEHAEWQNKINFYKAELKKFNDQLGEILLDKPDSSAMAEIEHFQNQFMVQKEVLDIMRHDFKQHENAIEHKQENINIFDSSLSSRHENHRERLLQFEKLFRELRDEFKGFSNSRLEKQY